MLLLHKIKQIADTLNSRDRAYDAIKSDIIDSGEISVLEAIKILKIHKDMFDELSKDVDISRAALDEADNHPGKDINEHGAKFSVRNLRPTWDYSKCNYQKYDAAKSKVESSKDELKNVEAFLQKLKEPVVIEDTGECIYPPLKYQKTKVTISLKE